MDRSKWLIARLILLSVLFLAGCNEPPAPIQYHSSGLRDVASLDVYADGGTIHLLLAGTAANAASAVLHYTRSDNGGATWSAPVPVTTGGSPPYAPHRGNDVQLAASGDRLVAVWTTAGTGFGGSGPLATAVSGDGGRAWQPGPNPADDGSTAGHAFADVASDGNGNFHLVWLDNRSGGQGLYRARSTDGGRHWSRNTPIDAATCECCWNTIRASADGDLFVLYRNIDPRDMALAGSQSGKAWQRLGTVGNFDWHFAGCPHTGGGLAIAPGSERLHAVVWTGKDGTASLYHLTSTDSGHHWGQPQRLGDHHAHHADIAARDADRVAAVWDTAGPQGHTIIAALSADGGRTWKQHRLHHSGALASHPRVIATRFGWRVFWTEQRSGAETWAVTKLSVK